MIINPEKGKLCPLENPRNRLSLETPKKKPSYDQIQHNSEHVSTLKKSTKAEPLYAAVLKTGHN